MALRNKIKKDLDGGVGAGGAIRKERKGEGEGQGTDPPRRVSLDSPVVVAKMHFTDRAA